MAKGEHDFKYAFTFIHVITDLHEYSKSGKLENPNNKAINNAIEYLGNLITIDRITKDNLRHDYKQIKNGIETALDDTVDFNRIMPDKYKTLKVWDKCIQVLEGVLNGEAKKEDTKESIDFFEALSDGYHHFIDENRHNIFNSAGAWA